MCSQDSTCDLHWAANTSWLEQFDDDGLWAGGVVQLQRAASLSPAAQRGWRGRLMSILHATKQWLLAPVGFPLQLSSAARHSSSH